VIEDDGEDGNTAESLKFGDVLGQPGWALDGQGGRLAGENPGVANDRDWETCVYFYSRSARG
jgi:hypothetical protein